MRAKRYSDQFKLGDGSPLPPHAAMMVDKFMADDDYKGIVERKLLEAAEDEGDDPSDRPYEDEGSDADERASYALGELERMRERDQEVDCEKL